MATTSFNALEVARELKAAGINPDHAETLAGAMLKAAGADRDEFATKADLAELRAELRAEMARMKADLYRAMIIQGGAIVALIAALKLIP